MNQMIIRACLLGVVTIAGTAHAAPDSKTFDLKLRAEVPVVGGFEVTPVGWNLAEQQPLPWDAEQKKFGPLTLQVNLKSGVGDVRVKLANTDEKRLAHASDADAYYVLGAKVGDKDVTADPVSVVSKEDAKAGKQVALQIMPTASEKVAATPVAGQYAGELPLVFETVVE